MTAQYEVVQDDDHQWTVVAYWGDKFEAWGWFDTPEQALDSIAERNGVDQLKH